jgi:hypothetical protein
MVTGSPWVLSSHDVPGEVSPHRSVYCFSIRSELQHSADIEPSPPLTPTDEFRGCALGGPVPISNWPQRPPRDTQPKVMGLALLKDGGEGVFRRVGLVRWLRKSVFDEVEDTTATIVYGS